MAEQMRVNLNFRTSGFVPPQDSLPSERIRFDCPAGTQVSEANFPCVIRQVGSNPGVVFSADQLPVCRTSLPR